MYKLIKVTELKKKLYVSDADIHEIGNACKILCDVIFNTYDCTKSSRRVPPPKEREYLSEQWSIKFDNHLIAIPWKVSN